MTPPTLASYRWITAILLALGLVEPFTGRALGQAPNADPALNNPVDSEGVRFFETKIRPLLAEKCHRCHGERKQESGLRLDTWDGIRAGGDSGMAVVPGSPEESLVVMALSYKNEELQMPPAAKLPDRTLADVAEWIRMGAPHPDSSRSSSAEKPAPARIDPVQSEALWSFQPPRPVPLPNADGSGWSRSPLDRFIVAQLSTKGLVASAPADRATLVRRMTFDLTGLPPTVEEVSRCLADESPDATARLVDRLLASPRYGERWGRHWLDVARYADSNGLDENIAFGNAWRYRDYVIDALNADTPFDRFILEQLAGDLLPANDTAASNRQRTATGFLSLGPKVLAEVDATKMEMDIIDEQLDTTGRAFMGLTLGCARCHDHKFDPIGTEDYYGLAGIFKSTRTMENFIKIARWYEHTVATDQDNALRAAHDSRVAAHKAEIQTIVDRTRAQLRQQTGTEPPAGAEDRFPAEAQAQLQRLREELAAVEKSAPELPTAMGAAEGDVTDLPVHIRGSHLTLGRVVPRSVPRILAGTVQPPFDATGSGRRQLAEWLTSGQHPLTSRVIVNRLWRWHFGRGIVASPDNFGQLGGRPTNPALLDWLAVRFMEDDWSLKTFHRLVLSSSTYQMQSDDHPAAARVDPENELLWRTNPRRIEAEVIRDSILAVSGLLDSQMGGSLLHVKNREFLFDHTSKDGTRYDSWKRSIYLPVIRNHLYDAFQLFDFTDATVSNGDRSTSTVAPQALFFMNSDLVANAAQAWATAATTASPEPRQRVTWLYQSAFGRPATEAEIARALAFVVRISEMPASELAGPAAPTASVGAPPATPAASPPAATAPTSHADPVARAWQALCHVLFESNEFLYVR